MTSLIPQEIIMNAEQVAYFQKEYALNKRMETNACTVAERERCAAVCAELEKIGCLLGITQISLQALIGADLTIH